MDSKATDWIAPSSDGLKVNDDILLKSGQKGPITDNNYDSL